MNPPRRRHATVMKLLAETGLQNTKERAVHCRFERERGGGTYI